MNFQCNDVTYRRESNVSGQLNGSLKGFLALSKYLLSTVVYRPWAWPWGFECLVRPPRPPRPVAEKDKKYVFAMQMGPCYIQTAILMLRRTWK